MVWSRHFSGKKPECELLAEVLSMAGMSRMVVGHTIQPDGITSACDGRVHRIDVGLSKGCGDGPLQALELTDDGAPRVMKADSTECCIL